MTASSVPTLDDLPTMDFPLSPAPWNKAETGGCMDPVTPSSPGPSCTTKMSLAAEPLTTVHQTLDYSKSIDKNSHRLSELLESNSSHVRELTKAAIRAQEEHGRQRPTSNTGTGGFKTTVLVLDNATRKGFYKNVVKLQPVDMNRFKEMREMRKALRNEDPIPNQDAILKEIADMPSPVPQSRVSCTSSTLTSLAKACEELRVGGECGKGARWFGKGGKYEGKMVLKNQMDWQVKEHREVWKGSREDYHVFLRDVELLIQRSERQRQPDYDLPLRTKKF